MPPVFIRDVLKSFNAGERDAVTAAHDLGVSRARLYQLRTDYLRAQDGYAPCVSGGGHRPAWPAAVLAFLEEFLPLQKPPNYQLVTDELARLHGFKRARSTVEVYVKSHLAHWIPTPEAPKRVYRRFRRAAIGELWQHDSSLHQWWPAGVKQVLLLTVDDHSGLIVGGHFVAGDTTWNHFMHFRTIFETWGIPQCIYTDGLSLFGASSADDQRDPHSEFQRALRGLQIAHLVAPTPQAKGKVERRFGTFQRRLVTLLAHAKAVDYPAADVVLQMEIRRQNQTINRSTGKVPLEVWEQQRTSSLHKMRSCPSPVLLDLHLALRARRRVNNDSTIDFEGQNFEIAATHKKVVSIVHHPQRMFWVVESIPKDVWPAVLGAFTL